MVEGRQDKIGKWDGDLRLRDEQGLAPVLTASFPRFPSFLLVTEATHCLSGVSAGGRRLCVQKVPALSCVAPARYTYQVVEDEKDRLSPESPSEAKGVFVLSGPPIFNPPDQLKLENVIISHFDEDVASCTHISGRSIGQKFSEGGVSTFIRIRN